MIELQLNPTHTDLCLSFFLLRLPILLRFDLLLFFFSVRENSIIIITLDKCVITATHLAVLNSSASESIVCTLCVSRLVSFIKM